MISILRLLTLGHLVGLALGVGCATAKLTLLVRARADHDLLPLYFRVSRPVTRWIIAGQSLLTLTGIGWLVLGYTITPLLIAKIVLVGALWVVGPLIDNVFEPRFRRSAPGAGEPMTPEFILSEKRLLLIEGAATGLFYVILVTGVMI